jgi:diacylglycerol O-acyltransferase / trehalose O-mycolyltransferase
MRAAGVALVTATVLLVGLLTASPAVAAPSPVCRPRTAPPQVGLTLVSTTPVDARTTLYTFRSAAVGGPVRVRVTLPVGYDGGDRRYPVLVHLHGARNSPTTWPAAEVEQVVGDTPVILVQPDGGAAGGYADWYGTPVSGVDSAGDPVPFPPPAWETFHIDELLPWVDATFRTTGHRAVAGSSMGGAGSMAYPARHPGTFDAAASLSGAVDNDGLFPVAPLLIQLGSPCVLGDRVAQASNWEAHNPTRLAPQLRGVSLYVTAGDGLPGPHDDVVTAVRDAPVEIVVRQLNDDLVAALGRAGVPVTTAFRHGTHPSPTGPNRWYDYDALRAFLPQAMAAMGASS